MIFTKSELLTFNEMMLGRGVPTVDDGVGYNKADYGACSTYYHGLSDAQYSDLAKRLVKYCDTQLNVCKETMKRTADELSKVANPDERSDGVSIQIGETHTVVGFRYNERYIEVIKGIPKTRRIYDIENKVWLVANEFLLNTLDKLKNVGADVENAIKHAKVKDVNGEQKRKVVVSAKHQEDMVVLQFDYNQDILNEIKRIDKKDRRWNKDNKSWSVKASHIDSLKSNLEKIATFKVEKTNLF